MDNGSRSWARRDQSNSSAIGVSEFGIVSRHGLAAERAEARYSNAAEETFASLFLGPALLFFIQYDLAGLQCYVSASGANQHIVTVRSCNGVTP